MDSQSGYAQLMAVRTLPAPFVIRRLPWRLLANILALMALGALALHLGNIAPAGDAISYYTANGEHLYGHRLGEEGYAYSPAFAQLIGPLQSLPFDLFRAAVAGAELFSLAYLFGPVAAFAVVLFQAWPLWAAILHSGNLPIFAAAMLVLALRHPAAWPVSILLKVTPGIGILWPALRRDWRGFGIGVGLTLAVMLVSAAVFGVQHWVEWVTWMFGSVDVSADRPGLPFWSRLLTALGVMVYAARTDRIWLVPLAAAIAAPEGGGHWLLLLGVWPLWRDSHSGEGLGAVPDAQEVERARYAVGGVLGVDADAEHAHRDRRVSGIGALAPYTSAEGVPEVHVGRAVDDEAVVQGKVEPGQSDIGPDSGVERRRIGVSDMARRPSAVEKHMDRLDDTRRSLSHE